MKKITALCVAVSLTLGSIGSAQADWGRHGGHGGHRPHYGGGYRGGPGWVGPAAILAITGLAIGAAAYSQSVRAAPIYVEPQRAYQPPPPDSGNWYYCNSAGQYYPYIQNCPEGWQSVMPPR